MKLLDDHSGIEVLDRDDCRGLLNASEFGRLAITVGGSPEIFPVNYRLDGDAIIIRTGAGTKLCSIGYTEACFEIDGADRLNRSGWSVVAKGWIEELTHYDGPAWMRALDVDVDPWVGGDRPHVLCFHIRTLSGRRVGG